MHIQKKIKSEDIEQEVDIRKGEKGIRNSVRGNEDEAHRVRTHV